MRRCDIGCGTAEAKPCGNRQHQRCFVVQRPEIQTNRKWLGQSAKLRDAQFGWRDHLAVRFPQSGGHIFTAIVRRMPQRVRFVQCDDFVFRKRTGWKKLSRRVHFGAWGMIHDDEFGGIEVQHFAQFLSDLQNIFSILRWKHRLVTEPNVLLRISIN